MRFLLKIPHNPIMKLVLLLLFMLPGCSASTKPNMCHLTSRCIADPPVPVMPLESGPDSGPGPFCAPFVGGVIGGFVEFTVGAGTGISIAAALTPDCSSTILLACVGAFTGTFAGFAFGAYAFDERLVRSASMFMIEQAFV
ncbi:MULTISPECIES: hypothetical protein [Candidatus Cardinium]|uniref:hypothetical protein n=1 Tax=Candidatus Cardinium TaxID=273135 RepID=UPI001FA94A51|nr:MULTISPECIES: hypothetical protein [Cardinium]